MKRSKGHIAGLIIGVVCTNRAIGVYHLIFFAINLQLMTCIGQEWKEI